MRVTNNIVIKDARMLFKNFSGVEKQYNLPGQRNFCAIIEPKLASILEADGWNIRWPDPDPDGDARKPYIQVTVSFENFPPMIRVLTNQNEKIIEEDEVNMLDWADIKRVDVVIRPYNWVLYPGKKNEKTGVKAYLKEMKVTLQESELDKESDDDYNYVPMSPNQVREQDFNGD